MKTLVSMRPLACLPVVTLLTACLSVPVQLSGEYPPLTPERAGPRDVGTAVRWGGVILDTVPDEQQTCFEILSRNLSRSMRPEPEDQTLGRFIACKDGFHDPAIFARGREVTLTGTIHQLDSRKVGSFDYTYPVVAAGFVTMWPERPEVIFYDSYDPFYTPYYWYGPIYRPYPYPPYPRPRAYRNRATQGERVDINGDESR